jgi:hypothetical protein
MGDVGLGVAHGDAGLGVAWGCGSRSRIRTLSTTLSYLLFLVVR